MLPSISISHIFIDNEINFRDDAPGVDGELTDDSI